MNEYEEIMDDIYSFLEGSNEDYLDYLNIKKEKYKYHPKYLNILDKILILEKQYFSNEEKDAYNKMLNDYCGSIEYASKRVLSYLENDDYVNGKKILESLIKSFSDSYINDEFGNCVYFNNVLEEERYNLINKDNRKVFVMKVNKGYVYYLYARVLLQLKDYDKAILALDLACTYTPFLTNAYYLKAFIYKINKKMDRVREELLLVHKYIYNKDDEADYYYFLGNYLYKFIDKEKEYLMYNKSYNLKENEELKNDILKESKLEFNEDKFLSVCENDNLPSCSYLKQEI